MGLSTLAGHTALPGTRLSMPAWGRSYAEVTIDAEATLSGPVSFALADLTMSGTILSGGPAKGRSFYRVVAGNGGWGRTIPKRSYANDALVTHRQVLRDAATECGETLDETTVDAALTVGPGFVRPEGPAVRVLERVAPQNWHVGEDGITRVGRRTARALRSTVTKVAPFDEALGKLQIASETIANVVPGVTIDGVEAVDVLHEITAKGLRSTLWSASGSGSGRRATLHALVEQLAPRLRFSCVYEYRVVVGSGKRWDLQPVRVSAGMPDLLRVPAWPGVSGCEAELMLGSRVLVGFIDADQARPYIAGFEDADGEGFVPELIKLAGGDDFVALSSPTEDTFALLKAQLGLSTDFANFQSRIAGLPLFPLAIAAEKVKAT